MKVRRIVAALLLFAAVPAGAAEPNPHNSLDCVFCHDGTPIFGIDTRETVGFYRFEADDPSLCYVCHRPEENLHPVGVAPGEGSLAESVPAYLPLATSEERAGTVTCTTCHFIHAATADHSLLRGFAGSQQPDLFYAWQDLCRQCHGEGLEERSPHFGDERSCSYCHAATPGEGVQVEVMPRGIALCNFCHGTMQADHLQGVNPFAGEVNCLTCHGPHLGAESPGRLKKGYFDYLRGSVTIDPHNRRHLCSLCHIEEKTYTLVTTDRNALCSRCHATAKVVGESHPLSVVPEGMTIPEGWPLRKGRLGCDTCHLAGHPEEKAERGKALLRGGPYDNRGLFCQRCHRDAARRQVNPHDQIKDLKGCEVCHSRTPVFGKDTGKTVDFTAAVNIVCLLCHDDTPHPGNAVHTMALDSRRAAEIPYYFPLDRYDRITCATCHNPHLGEDGNIKLRESMAGMVVCTGCHRF